MNDSTNDDLTQLKAASVDYYNKSEELLAETEKFVSKIQDSTNKKGKGFSLLNIKNQEIISCLTNSVLLICKLSMGESVEGTKIIEVISFQRKIIEKFRNINPKIKNQIDYMCDSKLEQNGTQLCARPDALIIDSENDESNEDVEDEEDEEEEEEENQNDEENINDNDNSDCEDENDKLNKKNIKSKILPLQINDEENDTKQIHRINRLKKQALKSSLVKDLKKEYSDAPEEYIEGEEILGDQFNYLKKERKKYEENYFIRLPTNKREKHIEKKKFERSGMDSLLSFGKYKISDETDNSNNINKKKFNEKNQRKRKFGTAQKFSKKFKKSKKKK